MRALWKKLLPLALLATLAVPAAFAQAPAPDALVQRVSDEVLGALRSDAELRGGNPAKLRALVESKVLPYFDFQRATQMAVGASWRRATPEQRERLVGEFRTLLVRTYSGALSSYRDQAIEYLPLRAHPGDTEVTVRSRIRHAGAEPVTVEYDLEREAGGWKVYDVRVLGVSLVANYRTSFAEEIRNRGLDGLIERLAARNRS